MEITNEQYEQVVRYVDDEMNAAESKAFEAVIIQNIDLRNEVEFYKEIRSLCESIEQKMYNINMFNKEKPVNDEVLLMIKKARTDWENTYENKLRKEQGLALREEKNIPTQEGHNIIEMTRERILASEKENVQQFVNEEGKVKRIYRSKWLAAAVLAGFISLGVIFWYFPNNNEASRIAHTKKELQPEVVHKDKNPGSKQKLTPSGLVPKAADKSSSDSAVQERIKAEREKIFAKNFKPDDLPSEIPGPLEDPSADYVNSKSHEAIEGYKKVIADIKETENSDVAARGDDDNLDLLTFYAHYYLAQSYMSINMAKLQ